MEITEQQYRRFELVLPRQRGNVSLPNLMVLNAMLYVAEQGCKWRGLPKRFGNWHTIYTRMNPLVEETACSTPSSRNCSASSWSASESKPCPWTRPS